jgi:hypothetical protein
MGDGPAAVASPTGPDVIPLAGVPGLTLGPTGKPDKTAAAEAGISSGAGAAVSGLALVGTLAAAGAAAGVPFFGVGAAVGAAAGALMGLGIVIATKIVPAYEGGTSHQQRMNNFAEAIMKAHNANSADVGDAIQAAGYQINKFVTLAAEPSAQDPVAASVLAAASAANDALTKAGDALVDDVNTFNEGKDKINPWQMTPAGAALGKFGADVAAVNAALAAATPANDALEGALVQASHSGGTS